MKINIKQFLEGIDRLVKKRVSEELGRRLPVLIEKVLTEKYIKNLFSEHSAGGGGFQAPLSGVVYNNNRKKKVREVLDLGNDYDDEHIPEPLANDDHGIYEPDAPMFKEQRERVLNKLSEGDPALRKLFEGVTPIKGEGKKGEASASFQEAVPEQILNQLVDMDKLKRIASVVAPKKKKQSNQIDNYKLQQLERYRENLSKTTYGTPPSQASQTTTVLQESYSPSSLQQEEDPYEARMRELDSMYPNS